MTKAELIDNLHKQASDTMTKKACAELVEEMFNQVANAIKKNGRFSFPGFGTFTVRKRKARTGRNPQTGKEIQIPASLLPAFRPGKALKDEVNHGKN